MPFSIPSAVVGAILGATISSLIGPLAREQINKRFLYDSYWDGKWNTVTCWPNNIEYRWSIEFDQSGNDVIGRLTGTSENTAGQRALLWGSVKITQLSADWAQYTNPKDLGGTAKFVLDDSGDSFSGSITNGENTARWEGRRDGSEPSCQP